VPSARKIPFQQETEADGQAGPADVSSRGRAGAPKQIEIWVDLPRSKVGKVLKPDIRARLV
jgi:fatty-acyl-CoA synthase